MNALICDVCRVVLDPEAEVIVAYSQPDMWGGAPDRVADLHPHCVPVYEQQRVAEIAARRAA